MNSRITGSRVRPARRRAPVSPAPLADWERELLGIGKTSKISDFEKEVAKSKKIQKALPKSMKKSKKRNSVSKMMLSGKPAEKSRRAIKRKLYGTK